MEIFLKYQKIITEHKKDNTEIQTFFENVGFKDFKIKMEGKDFKITLPSTQKFILKLNENKLKEFCKEKGFVFKNIL
jgi:hypothetical protein